MADTQVKRKVVVPGRMSASSSRPSSPTKIRSPSPVKRFPAQPAAPVAAPAPRLKAKVSSGAKTSANRKAVTSLSPGYVSGASTPRATSPVRQQLDTRQGRLSPKPSTSALSRVRAKPTNAAASAPSSPLAGFPQHAQPSAIPASTSDTALARASPPRVRHVSIGSASQLSSASSLRANGVLSPPSSVVSVAYESDVQSETSTRKIKAKLTGLAKGKPPTAPSSPMLAPSPTFSPPQQFNQRIGRTPSISSISSAKEPTFYPITTASPSANVHRFATVHTPTAPRRSSNCFPSPLQTTYVDPSRVPLPPNSPPGSTVSFSSQSSVSRSTSSSVNNDTPAQLNVNIHGPYDQFRSYDAMNIMNGESSKPRSHSIILGELTNGRNRQGSVVSIGTDLTDEQKTIKAEAKSIRKIADLEITNKSLLTINSQLEANKHKQAKEIRELRRKLRESRLILPPRTYSALNEDGAEEGGDDDGDEENVSVDEKDELEEIDKLGKEDEHFSRVRSVLDALLESGRRALQTKAEDFAPPRGTAKVLHEEEARTWRDAGSQPRIFLGHDGDETFDETFVTAESGDENEAFAPGMSSSNTIRDFNSSSEGLVQVVVKDVDSD